MLRRNDPFRNEILPWATQKIPRTHHKPCLPDRRLRIRHSQEHRDRGLDPVHVGHPGPVELLHPGPVVQVDEEPVDPAVVGVDGHVAGEVLAAGTALALKKMDDDSFDNLKYLMLIHMLQFLLEESRRVFDFDTTESRYV